MTRGGSAVLALAATLALTTPAGASWSDNLASIHFNSNKPDFGIPPRRGLMGGGEQDDRPGSGWGNGTIEHAELSYEHDNERAANRQRALRETQHRARTATERGDWLSARRLWEGFAMRFGKSGIVQDRCEVLVHTNPPAEPLRRYLAALDALEGPNTGWNAARRELAALHAESTLPPWLREHAAYQHAAGLVQWLNYKEATSLWQAQIRQFPEGEKREAALLMIARACLLHKAIPDSVRTGRAATEQLLRAFPQTRFRVAARGLLARADLDEGRYEAAATTYCALNDGDSIAAVRRQFQNTAAEPRLRTLQLIAYLRALPQATDFRAYRFAVKGISHSLALFKPDTGRVFLERLVREPELAAPYFYFRLYHCDNKPADLVRLTLLADRIAAREALPPVVRVRLAELYYQAHAYRRAATWASSATGMADEKVRARALYVRAGSRYRQKRFEEARADLEQVLTRCPRSNIRHATRELLALVAEAQGDLPTALDQYLALDYRDDYAYLIDARLPIATLESYQRTRTHHKELLAYSIALRHLRIEQWAQARRWLARVPAKSYAAFALPESYKDEWWAESLHPTRQTLESLAFLDLKSKQARGAEAKAAARFAYARAYYTQGLLQLYNAPLWQGERMFAFNYFWNRDVATPADDRAVQRYMYQHEVYAHTRQICLEIAADYPQTKSAPAALYRAACAAEKLEHLNEWWRTDEKGRWWAADSGWDEGKVRRRNHPLLDHRKEASQLMALFVRRYPKHPLAKDARKYADVFVGKGEPAEES
ncbi:tetratricopeptide repeat protein [Armatimonas rosea]|uniref:TolA-binding protein n=1 Tax=Armatimonas rosea TaxID=685828 RepID=A0A7W9SPS5_ARMRO|nr:hypothetical protein [Armatimonas rosea]MBB6050541.1 TolA-binding protein [Armatimonas rosea]